MIRITFKRALIIAAIVHFIALAVYAMKYRPDIVEVPFKAVNVNIKIGKVYHESHDKHHVKPKDAAPEDTKKVAKPKKQEAPVAQQKPVIKPQIIEEPMKKEAIVEKKVVVEENPVPPQQPKKQAKKETPAPPNPAEDKINLKGAKGSELGNVRSADKETIENYEQRLSLWLHKHKNYPREAKRRKLEGDGIVYIQIDRKGNIIYSKLILRTGHKILDQAIADMVARSNPVPPIPKGYGSGEIIGFRIPVEFLLERRK